jgi:hypothetical protein
VAIVAVRLSRIAAAAIDRHASHRVLELLLGAAVPLVIVMYMLKFSESYPDRITHNESGPARPAATRLEP